MDFIRKATVPLPTDLPFIRAVLVFSASFLFSEVRSREDQFVTQEYVLAVLLFNLSLLFPSNKLTYPPATSPRWIFILLVSMGLFYYSVIPLSLFASLRHQANTLLGEYEKSCGRWFVFRLFVLVHTVFTGVMRTNRLVKYFKETGKVVSSPNERNKDV